MVSQKLNAHQLTLPKPRVSDRTICHHAERATGERVGTAADFATVTAPG